MLEDHELTRSNLPLDRQHPSGEMLRVTFTGAQHDGNLLRVDATVHHGLPLGARLYTLARYGHYLDTDHIFQEHTIHKLGGRALSQSPYAKVALDLVSRWAGVRFDANIQTFHPIVITPEGVSNTSRSPYVYTITPTLNDRPIDQTVDHFDALLDWALFTARPPFVITRDEWTPDRGDGYPRTRVHLPRFNPDYGGWVLHAPGHTWESTLPPQEIDWVRTFAIDNNLDIHPFLGQVQQQDLEDAMIDLTQHANTEERRRILWHLKTRRIDTTRIEETLT